MLSGVLIIDKPYGVSSGEHIRKLKKIIGKEKIGHAGTLDPLATGILIVCLGQMTRFSDYLAAHSKTYEAEILFGNKYSLVLVSDERKIDEKLIYDVHKISKYEKIKTILTKDSLIKDIDKLLLFCHHEME